FFFFSSRRRHTRSKRDWSSDVCSSDLDRGSHGGLFQRCLGFFPVRCIQLGSQIPPAEIVGVGAPRGAQRLQLLPALLDQPVVFFHFYTPCLRLAVMKSSRSPSSTDCVLPVSTPVRRSLMRDWSST